MISVLLSQREGQQLSEEDTLGVYVKHGDKTEFVPVDILIERDGECIIEPQNDNYTISPGMEIKP